MSLTMTCSLVCLGMLRRARMPVGDTQVAAHGEVTVRFEKPAEVL